MLIKPRRKLKKRFNNRANDLYTFTLNSLDVIKISAIDSCNKPDHINFLLSKSEGNTIASINNNLMLFLEIHKMLKVSVD